MFSSFGLTGEIFLMRVQPETGWFSYNLLENLKYRVQVRFLSVFPKPGAERLLKAATESFKKSKKICNKDNLVRDEMVQQQTNAGTRGKLHLLQSYCFH